MYSFILMCSLAMLLNQLDKNFNFYLNFKLHFIQ